MKQLTTRSLVALFIALAGGAMLAGCATSEAPSPAASPNDSNATATLDPSAADVFCKDLSGPMPLALNAWNDLQEGSLSEEQRARDLNTASPLLASATPKSPTFPTRASVIEPLRVPFDTAYI